MSITVGLTGEACVAVTDQNTAQAMGSGSLPVFATPAMAALMEQAACNALSDFLEPGQSSVGTALSLSHLSATPVGMSVRAQATVTEVEGRKVTFSVTASDEAGLIGEGTHQRVVIDSVRFLTKAQSKGGVSHVH